MQKSLILIFISYLLFCFNGILQAQDGIPDNCEHAATLEDQSQFPRYEFHNKRVVLVNWATGEDVVVLDHSLTAEAVYFRQWTVDCRYLIGTVQINNLSDFVVWDTLSGQRVLTISGRAPFFLCISCV